MRVTAQTLVGQVSDVAGRRIVGVSVALFDSDGARRAITISDSLGRFTLTPPTDGDYVIQATRIGYESITSPLFALTIEGSVPVEITMDPEPIGLEGFDVAVETNARELLVPFGLSPADLGTRWIESRDIDDMPLPPGPREVLRWRAIPGIWLVETSPPSPPILCARFRRGNGGCALTLLNGVPVDIATAQAINPSDLRAIAILTPIEATTYFGTDGGRGVIMLWTR